MEKKGLKKGIKSSVVSVWIDTQPNYNYALSAMITA